MLLHIASQSIEMRYEEKQHQNACRLTRNVVYPVYPNLWPVMACGRHILFIANLPDTLQKNEFFAGELGYIPINTN